MKRSLISWMARSASRGSCAIRVVATLGVLVAACSGANPGVGSEPPSLEAEAAARQGDPADGGPTGPDVDPRASGDEVERVGDLTVLTLRGSPARRGALVGRVFGQEIRSKTQRYVREYLAAMLGGSELALASARAMESEVPEDARAEMRALAQAAGVTYEDILLFNVFSDLLTTGCVTVVASGDASEGRVLRFARNVDLPMPPEMQPPSLLVIVHPDDGLSWAGYLFPGMIGPPTAINERGVAISVNGSATARGAAPCVPIAFSTRSALERSESARSLVASLERVSHCGGFLVTAADATEGLTLEISPSRTERLAEPGGLLLVTNHYRTEPMLPLQSGAQEGSRRRLEALRRRLSSGPAAGLGASDLREALMDEDVRQPFTLMSVVIEPAARVMWLWERGRPMGDFIEVSVRERLSGSTAPAARP